MTMRMKVNEFTHFFVSRREESNPQPSLYKSAALPLSYSGKYYLRPVSASWRRTTPATYTFT